MFGSFDKLKNKTNFFLDSFLGDNSNNIDLFALLVVVVVVVGVVVVVVISL